MDSEGPMRAADWCGSMGGAECVYLSGLSSPPHSRRCSYWDWTGSPPRRSSGVCSLLQDTQSLPVRPLDQLHDKTGHTSSLTFIGGLGGGGLPCGPVGSDLPAS